MDKDYGVSGYANEKEFKKMIKELNCDFDKVKEYVEDVLI